MLRVADPDGRLRYKINPVNLLEADGAFRTDLAAGARFVLNAQLSLERTHVIDYRVLRARTA